MALERLMRYIKGTMDLCIVFSGFAAVLEGFYDAN